MKRKMPFESEFILHKLTEKHLKELFGLDCVASEIQLNRLRLDNFAFNPKTNSFVIIEYKNEFNADVLTQIQGYHDLIRENPEYFKARLDDCNEVDSENIRMMVIGPEFSQDQIDEAKGKIEIWKITLFDDCKVTYENLHTNEIKTLCINSKDLKLTEDDLLEGKSSEMRELYFNVKNSIMDEFDDVKIKYLVDMFSLRANDKLICVVSFLKSSFNVYLYGENLENADKTEDISDKTTGGNANYNLKYKSADDLECFMNLFKQVYNQKVEK